MSRLKKLRPDENAQGNHTVVSEMPLKTKYPEETKINDLLWLQNWYKEHCNGDREHSYGISIQTIDNPGWKLSVSLEDTELENAVYSFSKVFAYFTGFHND